MYTGLTCKKTRVLIQLSRDENIAFGFSVNLISLTVCPGLVFRSRKPSWPCTFKIDRCALSLRFMHSFQNIIL